MSFYRERVLPHLVNMAMTQAAFEPYRRRVISNAKGRVLEVGIGSGINLPLYAPDTRIIGLDPSARLLSMARKINAAVSCSIELIEGTAEHLPLPNQSVDGVVTTWTLCSIPDLSRALSEMRRVLKPGGRLLFVEHGRSPEPHIVRWQNRLTPVWKQIAGGCHLNRPIDQLIREAGFRVDTVQTGYMDGPKPMTFMYEGIAHPM